MKAAWIATIVALTAVTAAAGRADTTEVEAARALLDAHRYDLAMAAVEEYLNRNPKDPAATIVKSDIYAAWGQWDRSVEVLEDALSQHERDVELLLALAVTYREKMMRSGMFTRMSNAKKSSRTLEKAFATDPTHLRTRRQMVMYLVHAPGFAGGDKERAEKIALETIEMDETEGRYQLAAVYRRRDRLDASAEQCRRVLDLAPDRADALLMLGEVLLEKEDDAGCEKLFLSYIAEWPERPEPYAGLGDCYQEQRRWDESIPHYLAALERDPWYGDARYKVARMYEKIRNEEQAAYHYRIFLERNPGHVEAGTAKKHLRKIEKGR